MPAPVPIGTRYGALLIVSRVPSQDHLPTPWCLTRCDCGTEEPYPLRRLSGQRRDLVRACSVCEAPSCIVCDRKFTGRTTKRICSAGECRSARKREIWNASYHRTAADPEKAAQRSKDVSRRRAARVVMDPDAAAAEALRKANWKRKREEAEPHLAHERLARARTAYALRAAETQRRRRKHVEQMTPEQLARWIERGRAYGRAYRQRWRAELAKRPEEHRSYLDRMAEWRRQRRLLQLMTHAGAVIGDRG